MFDIIIENALIINGKNETPYYGDIAVQGDGIAEIGDLGDADARERIDATGHIITPGFIDCHCHSDALILHEKKNPKRVVQGITTEIIGNCGISAAPVNPAYLDQLKKYCAPMFGNIDLPYDWRSFGEYLDTVKQAKPVLNVAALVGHGAIRTAVMGFDDRTPTEGEMEEMERLLQECLDQGAIGMSTGLVYPPGFYSQQPELVALAKVLKANDAIYTTHMRSETFKVVESVADSIDIARQSGVNFQISHHKASGYKNKGKSYTTVAMIEKAHEEGLNIHCDVYPYTAASTQFSAVLPPWALEGGVEKLMERLADPKARERIKADMQDEHADFENVSQNTTWDKIIISQCSVKKYEGKSVKAIAEEQGMDIYDTVFEILSTSRNNAMMILYLMDESDVSHIIKSKHSMISSDGIPSLAKYHPRYIGAFARVLDHYVKETYLLSLPEAVYKMTGLPAGKFGIAGRGVIEKGYKADLVMIDFAALRDNATYDDFDATADGIKLVMLNGKIAAREGVYTGLCAGEVLR